MTAAATPGAATRAPVPRRRSATHTASGPSAQSANVTRQPSGIASTGRASPLTRIAAGMPDCLMPKPRPCRSAGISSETNRLIAGWQTAFATPATASRSSSTTSDSAKQRTGEQARRVISTHRRIARAAPMWSASRRPARAERAREEEHRHARGDRLHAHVEVRPDLERQRADQESRQDACRACGDRGDERRERRHSHSLPFTKRLPVAPARVVLDHSAVVASPDPPEGRNALAFQSRAAPKSGVMNVPALLPSRDLLTEVYGVERGLRRGRRARLLGVLLAAVQIAVLLANSSWVDDLPRRRGTRSSTAGRCSSGWLRARAGDSWRARRGSGSASRSSRSSTRTRSSRSSRWRARAEQPRAGCSWRWTLTSASASACGSASLAAESGADDPEPARDASPRAPRRRGRARTSTSPASTRYASDRRILAGSWRSPPGSGWGTRSPRRRSACP